MILPLLKSAKRRILLSGTPAFARSDEIYSQISAVCHPDPDSGYDLDPDDAFQNLSLYNSIYGRGKWGNSAKNKNNMPLLYRNLGAIMIRRYKREILKELPCKLRIVVRQRCSDSKLMAQICGDMELLLEAGKGRTAIIGRQLKKKGKRKTIKFATVRDQISKKVAKERKDKIEKLEGDMEERALNDFEDASDIDARMASGMRAIERSLVLSKAQHMEEADTFRYNNMDIVGHPRQRAEAAEEVDAEELQKVLMKLFKNTGLSKIDVAVRHVEDMYSPGNPDRDQKLCIFAHHLDVLNGIQSKALGNIKHIRIDGSTPPKRRQELVTQFQEDPSIKVALLSITAAGVAITLTAAARTLFAELFWTPAMLHQCEDRCHRIGQTKIVKAKYLIAKDTVDTILWELTRQKFQQLGEFIEGKGDETIEIDADKKAGKPAYKWGKKEEKKKVKKRGEGGVEEEVMVDEDEEVDEDVEEGGDGDDDDGDGGGRGGGAEGEGEGGLTDAAKNAAKLLAEVLLGIGDEEIDAAEFERTVAGGSDDEEDEAPSVVVALGLAAGGGEREREPEKKKESEEAVEVMDGGEEEEGGGEDAGTEVLEIAAGRGGADAGQDGSQCLPFEL